MPEWVIFNEFVLTSKSFIRTVTTVKAEWYVLSFEMYAQTPNSFCLSRLLEYGGEYFNFKTFPEGEAKTAHLGVMNKRMGKRTDEESGAVERRKKKRRNVKERPTSGPTSGPEPVSGLSSLVDNFRTMKLSTNHNDTAQHHKKKKA